MTTAYADKLSGIESGLADELMRRDADALEATVVDGCFRASVYRFARPSVTAGRNARVSEDEVARWRMLGHEFARRPTGGGVIRHEDDISFGIVIPSNAGFASEALKDVSAALADSLAEQGIETTCRGMGTVETPGRCFQAAVGVERLFRGEKLVGLAARRVRGAVLVQGSMTVRRFPERDAAVLGVGPRVDLEGTGFEERRFARRFLSIMGHVSSGRGTDGRAESL